MSIVVIVSRGQDCKSQLIQSSCFWKPLHASWFLFFFFSLPTRCELTRFPSCPQSCQIFRLRPDGSDAGGSIQCLCCVYSGATAYSAVHAVTSNMLTLCPADFSWFTFSYWELQLVLKLKNGENPVKTYQHFRVATVSDCPLPVLKSGPGNIRCLTGSAEPPVRHFWMWNEENKPQLVFCFATQHIWKQ